MPKTNPAGRFLITGQDLESLARCSLSMNYLSRIQANLNCRDCVGLGAAGRYMLQRSFRGTRVPTPEFLTKTYSQAIDPTGAGWATRYAYDQRAVLDHLRDWGKGVWEKIDSVNVAAETHHGLYTIHQLIDVILKVDGRYVMGQFSCNAKHAEQILHYRTLHASLWLREAYDVETNDVMIIRLTPHGPEFNTRTLGLSTKILRNAITSILSKVDTGAPKTAAEHEQALAALPPNPGEHCHACLGCFALTQEMAHAHV